MSNLNVNLAEVHEQTAVPKGRYELQITGAEEKETGENSKRPGSPMLRFVLGFTDLSLNAPMLSHYVTLPYEGDENTAFKLLQMKRFLEAFQIPYNESGIDTAELCMNAIGHTATCEVGLTDPRDDGEVFNKLIVPRLPKEGKHPPQH